VAIAGVISESRSFELLELIAVFAARQVRAVAAGAWLACFLSPDTLLTDREL
jgi:hypothetical protein